MQTEAPERADTEIVVAPMGEADVAWLAELEKRLMPLAERGAPRVVVDLRGAPRIDSLALGVLVLAQRKLGLAGGELAIRIDNPDVLRTLAVTGLDRFFEIDTR